MLTYDFQDFRSIVNEYLEKKNQHRCDTIDPLLLTESKIQF